MDTCGIKQYATCVYYELDIPPISSLTSEDCVTIEQTTQDLYNLISEQALSINVSTIDTNCLDNLPEDFTIIDVVKSQKEKICELEERVTNLENQNICELNIQNCGINLTGLVDECNEPITTLGQYLQLIAQNL